ncbi:hypothetical protein J6590_016739 [Homalodisca vitripennis]|nr:hypothetical protein J6590_016739 [Homalodisca vitripennis]
MALRQQTQPSLMLRQELVVILCQVEQGSTVSNRVHAGLVDQIVTFYEGCVQSGQVVWACRPDRNLLRRMCPKWAGSMVRHGFTPTNSTQSNVEAGTGSDTVPS